LLEPDAAFNEGVASLYAHDPILATYFLGCRADWLKLWADAHQGGTSDDAARPSPATMSVTPGRVAALVENVCVHLLANGLAKRTKSLVVVEIATGKRNREFMRRFEVVLAADGVTPWTTGNSGADASGACQESLAAKRNTTRVALQPCPLLLDRPSRLYTCPEKETLQIDLNAAVLKCRRNEPNLSWNSTSSR
jgi:hypothetical protein